MGSFASTPSGTQYAIARNGIRREGPAPFSCVHTPRGTFTDADILAMGFLIVHGDGRPPVGPPAVATLAMRGVRIPPPPQKSVSV